METFVPKEFYIEPPARDADPADWGKWLKSEALKRRAHKAAFTRASTEQPVELPVQSSWVKTAGVTRQSVPLGFVGSAEEGTCRVEASEDAQQELALIRADWADGKPVRGTKSKGRSARRRRNRKLRKGGGKG